MAGQARRYESASEVFEATIRSFRDSLPQGGQEAFQEFQSPQAMTEHIKDHCARFQKERKFSLFCNRLHEFAKAWEPFFDIVNIFVQASPEWAGVAWGAIRMVFLLSSHYSTFLEKIVTMFERIGSRLPSYKEHFECFVERRKRLSQSGGTSLDGAQSRLAMTLSYVYADIIQFCQSACKMFVTKKSGIRFHAGVIRDLFWTPFDTRFGSLLDRLRDHQELFDIEVRLEERKAQEAYYQHLEKNNTESLESHESIERSLKELKAQLKESEARVTAEFDNFLDSIITPAKFFQVDKKELAQREEMAIRDRIREIKTWIGAPEYMKEFERVRSLRLTQTGEWVTRMREYVSWHTSDVYVQVQDANGSSIMSPAPFGSRVLSLQAKPGYGKTTLSSFLIEELQLERSTEVGPTRLVRNVAFFHFTFGQPNTIDLGHAFRAILLQLLHRNQDNKQIIDALSLQMDVTGSGQLIASEDEVEQALALCVQLVPGSFFIFDGVDECTRPLEFLNRLYEICKNSYAKMVLLHRPDLRLPPSYDSCTKVPLTRALNLEDIKLYVLSETSKLSEPTLILGSLSKTTFVERIASRANGMFLWARLMMQYLNCPALSEAERLEAIMDVNLIEGLEELYGRILDRIKNKFRKEKDVVFKTLRMVAVAVRPLKLAELKIALAIRVGIVTTTANTISNFDSSWVFFCGSLLEERENGTICFMHSSVKDFLMSEETSEMDWHIDLGSCNAYISNICLSYLIYDIPASPLAGRHGQRASVDLLKASFPFLNYALLWVQHGENGASYFHSPSSSSLDPRPWTDLVSTLGIFLSRRFAVSVWIEASWTFRIEPRLQMLAKNLNSLPLWSEEIDSGTKKSLERLSELSEDLLWLTREWRHVLKFYPHEIWGASITAFSNSQFWYETTEMQVTRFRPQRFHSRSGLNELAEDSQIVIASQASTDGTLLGLITLWPPERYVRFVRTYSSKLGNLSRGSTTLFEDVLQKAAKYLCLGWKATYKAWKLNDKTVFFDVEIKIPPDQILNILSPSLKSQSPWRFALPVAFSSSLQRIVILKTVTQVTFSVLGSSQTSVYSGRTQILSPHIGQNRDSYDPQCYTIFEPFFSPDESAVAVIESQISISNAEKIRTILPSRTLTVWRHFGSPTMPPNFVFLGRHFVNNLNSRNQANFRNYIAFHPYLPFIAFPQWDRTSLWFLKERVTPDMVVRDSLKGLKFTDDGNFIEGYRFERQIPDNKLFLLPDWSDGEKLDGEKSDGETLPGEEGVLFDIQSSLQNHMSQVEMASYQTAATRNSGTWRLGISTADPPSALSNRNDLDAVSFSVLQGCRQQGPGDFYLPAQQDGLATFLTSIRDPEDWICTVWNKSPQETYSVFDKPDRHFPSIIERKRTSLLQDQGTKMKRSKSSADSSPVPEETRGPAKRGASPRRHAGT